MEKDLRRLRLMAWMITGFSVVLLFAGAAQIGFGAMAIRDYYRGVAAEEALQQRSIYSYDAQYRFELEYSRSSSAFLNPGRISQAAPELPAASSPVAIASIVFAVSGIGFLLAALAWIWRAHANLSARGIRAKFTKGRALSAYLIPGVNLILPFEAMRELHNRSHGEDEEHAHAPVEDVTAWWSAVVIGLLILSGMIVKFTLDAVSNIFIMTPLWMEYVLFCFAMLLMLGSAYLFSRLARTITRAQEEMLPALDPLAAGETVPARPSVRVLEGNS